MTDLRPLPPILYEDAVRSALAEDLGRAGDITTDSVIAPGIRWRADIVARAAGCIAGLDVALATFALLDPTLRTEVRVADGDAVAAGTDAGAGDQFADLVHGHAAEQRRAADQVGIGGIEGHSGGSA